MSIFRSPIADNNLLSCYVKRWVDVRGSTPHRRA
ncbi:hypothetical protein VPHK460_0301 [Vibrio phage K460]